MSDFVAAGLALYGRARRSLERNYFVDKLLKTSTGGIEHSARPEGKSGRPGGLTHYEKDCTGSLVCSHLVPCAFIRAGSGSHRAAASGGRTPPTTARPGLRLD
jgi:hypothetical protein